MNQIAISVENAKRLASYDKRSVIDGFLERARTSPDRVFCHFDGLQGGAGSEACSFGEAYDLVGRLGNALRRHGVKAGDIVVVLQHQSLNQIATFMASMAIGAVPTIIPPLTFKQDPELYWSSHRTLFNFIDAAAIVTFADNVEACRAAMPERSAAFLAIESLLEVDGSGFTPQPTTGQEIAFLQHSSGTTGLKKGVSLSHAAVLSHIEDLSRALSLGEDDRIASWLPLYHDMGLIACFILPLVAGVPFATLDPFIWVARPWILFDAIQRHNATLVWLPNFAFVHLCRTVRGRSYDLSCVRAFISCSEPAKPQAFDQFRQAFSGFGVSESTLQVSYAMAETVFGVTQTVLGQPVRRVRFCREAMEMGGRAVPVGADDGKPSVELLSCGGVLDRMEVRILGQSGEWLDRGFVGEIAVRSPYLFSGYFRRDEITAEAFHQGWYKTGDLGFLHEGELYVSGRLKDLVILHGKNLYAHDIEQALASVSGLKPGRVVAFSVYRAASGSEELVIVGEADGPIRTPAETKAIGDECRSLVSGALGVAPFDVVVVEQGWLVKTTSGKISRSENRRKYLTLKGEGYDQIG